MLDRADRAERKSALVDRELSRYKLDMAALSETRLSDVGEAAEANYTSFGLERLQVSKGKQGWDLPSRIA